MASTSQGPCKQQASQPPSWQQRHHTGIGHAQRQKQGQTQNQKQLTDVLSTLERPDRPSADRLRTRDSYCSASSHSPRPLSINPGQRSQHQPPPSGNEYYAREYVTGRRSRRQPPAMANVDCGDLDPLWQDLDW